MSKEGGKNFKEMLDALDEQAKKTGSGMLAEAKKTGKNITKEVQALSKKTSAAASQDNFKKQYESIERTTIRAMTDVLDKTKEKIATLKQHIAGKRSSDPAVKQDIQVAERKANAELESVRKESTTSLNDSISSKLENVCPKDDEYYSCTLKEAFKKASVLFDEQKRKYKLKSDKAYSDIRKEMDNSFEELKKSGSKSESSSSSKRSN